MNSADANMDENYHNKIRELGIGIVRNVAILEHIFCVCVC